MEDKLGQSINIGDTVAIAMMRRRSTTLRIGKIMGFGGNISKTLKMHWSDGRDNSSVIYDKDRIVKLNV